MRLQYYHSFIYITSKRWLKMHFHALQRCYDELKLLNAMPGPGVALHIWPCQSNANRTVADETLFNTICFDVFPRRVPRSQTCTACNAPLQVWPSIGKCPKEVSCFQNLQHPGNQGMSGLSCYRIEDDWSVEIEPFVAFIGDISDWTSECDWLAFEPYFASN